MPGCRAPIPRRGRASEKVGDRDVIQRRREERKRKRSTNCSRVMTRRGLPLCPLRSHRPSAIDVFNIGLLQRYVRVSNSEITSSQRNTETLQPRFPIELSIHKYLGASVDHARTNGREYASGRGSSLRPKISKLYVACWEFVEIFNNFLSQRRLCSCRLSTLCFPGLTGLFNTANKKIYDQYGSLDIRKVCSRCESSPCR